MKPLGEVQIVNLVVKHLGGFLAQDRSSLYNVHLASPYPNLEPFP